MSGFKQLEIPVRSTPEGMTGIVTMSKKEINRVELMALLKEGKLS